MRDVVECPAWTYRQYDADHTLDVPAENYDGWTETSVPLDPERTLFVSMHAWRTGAPGEFPGWERYVEYIPRARRIMTEVFPPLFSAIRTSGVGLVHVVGGNDYYTHLDGYRRAVDIAGPEPEAPLGRTAPKEAVEPLSAARAGQGDHNREDIRRGAAQRDFGEGAEPVDGEFVCENAHQLAAVADHLGKAHLVYCGFAVNWCLLMSPGGMLDMQRRGFVCSAVREAVTAVENRESARTEAHKEEALWRIALSFGLVFDLDPLLAALARMGTPS